MNKKVTDIHREYLEELFEVKVSDQQWSLFCEIIHERIVPNLFERIIHNSNNILEGGETMS